MKARFFQRFSRVEILFFGFLALLLFGFNSYISLWDQDEAAYAGFAKRMLETGRWIIPDFTWSEIHRKPPLHFWLMALSYKIFGINTFAVRFFSALAVWGSVALMWFKGARIFGPKTAHTAALLMAGNVFLMMLGKMAVTDGLMLFAYTWAGLSLLAYLKTGSKCQMLAVYIALALGGLVKGPPVFLWAGFWYLLLLVFYPGRRRLISLHPWLYGWFSLAPFAAWLWLAWQQNPDFVRWWLDWYVLRRTHSAVLNQTGPPGTYLLLFVLFFLPVLPLVWAGAVEGFHNFKKSGGLFRATVLWFVAGWLPYALLPSKLPAYVLAAYPALALLGGYAVDAWQQGRRKKLFQSAYIIQILLWFLLLAGLVAGFAGFRHFFHGRTQTIAVFLGIVVVIMLLWNWRGLIFYRAGRFRLALNLLLLQGLTWSFAVLLIILPLAEPLKNATRLTALTLSRLTQPQTPVIVAATTGHPPSLPFYLELYHPKGQKIYPSKPSEFVRKHLSSSSAVWILTPAQWERWQGRRNEIIPKFRVERISGLGTGSLGNYAYVILIPRE